MPWQEQTIMSQRREFVALALAEGANIRELCRRFGISPTTGYALLARFRAEGEAGLVDRSRRPQHAPRQTPPEVEAAVLELRDRHPTWGGRKLHHALRHHGHHAVPAASTITAILRRSDRIPPEPDRQGPYIRFERPTANALWQMDFLGHHPLDTGRVHPLTVLDDHSRFLLTLAACGDEQQPTVQDHLTACFARYGLPEAILTDNGPPWGTSGQGGLTVLEVWLLRLGIRVLHSRPYHPQTNGKVERVHRTILADVFGTRQFPDLGAVQAAFDPFRHSYNHDRPHSALDHAVPSSRYDLSPRTLPEQLPEIRYADDDAVRIVKRHGVIVFRNRRFFIGRGLAGQPVAVRETTDPARVTVHFCHRQIAALDLAYPDEQP